MASSRWTEADVKAHNARLGKRTTAQITEQSEPKRSKYRNVKTEALGILFDSKREAAEYLRLHARAQIGEIQNLRRQVSYPLMCPVSGTQTNVVVAHYIADFVYEEHGETRIVDAKGMRTQIYALKKKWLELQTGAQIVEI